MNHMQFYLTWEVCFHADMYDWMYVFVMETNVTNAAQPVEQGCYSSHKMIWVRQTQVLTSEVQNQIFYS